MDIKRFKECLKKELSKYEFEIESTKVGWAEDEDCLKIVLHVNNLEINLKDLKDIVESVTYFYTDTYILMLDL